MTRYDAQHIIYKVINSGIIDRDLEDDLQELATCVCDNAFEKCDEECMTFCKVDECVNAEY